MDAIRWADEAFAPLEPHFDRARWSLTDFQRQRLRAFIRHEIRGINRAMLARAGDEDTPEQREARREEVRVAQAALEKAQAVDKLAWEQRGYEREPRDWSYLPLEEGSITSYDLPAIDKYLAEIEATGAWTMLDDVFARGSVVSLIDERGLETDPEPEEAVRRDRISFSVLRSLSRIAIGSMRLGVSRAGQTGSADAVQRWSQRVAALVLLAEADRSLIGHLVSEQIRLRFLEELTFLSCEGLLSQRACESAITFLGQPRPILDTSGDVEMLAMWSALDIASGQVRASIPRKRAASQLLRVREGPVTRAMRAAAFAFATPAQRSLAAGMCARIPDWPEIRSGVDVNRGELAAILERVIATDRVHRTRIAGAQILMALNAHHAKNGAWPAKLEEIAPGVLQALPADIVSGEPWRYRVLAKPDEKGRPFLLYSIGQDLDDNAGNGHQHDWPMALRSMKSSVGFDYIVNDPRRMQDP